MSWTSFSVHSALVSLSVMFVGAGSITANAGKPVVSPPSDPAPVLVYRDRNNNVAVSDANGGNAKTVVFNTALSAPTWSPLGKGSAAQPWIVIYEADSGCMGLSASRVWVQNGALQTGPSYDITPTPPDPASCYATAPDLAGDTIVVAKSYTQAPTLSGVMIGTLDSSSSSLSISGLHSVYDADADIAVLWTTINSNASQVAFTEYLNTSPYGFKALKVLDVGTSSTTTAPITLLSDDSGFAPRGLEWDPQSRRVAFSSPPPGGGTEGIYILDFSSGATLRIADGYFPTWSADGNTIYFQSTTGVYSINADGIGKPKSIIKGSSHAKYRN